jgi:hypothetical protein
LNTLLSLVAAVVVKVTTAQEVAAVLVGIELEQAYL